jgi:uncharacterized protein YbdZ (MbtH family)
MRKIFFDLADKNIREAIIENDEKKLSLWQGYKV